MDIKEHIEMIEKMTEQEAIQTLTIFGQGKNALEALEKAGKYCWHDLRKDPDDLPKDKDFVLVWFKGTDLCDTIFVGGTTWTNHINPKKGLNPIIAWKYIEPFQESEECLI